MSTELDQRIEALTASVLALAEQVKDKENLQADRVEAIEKEIEAKSAAIDELLAEKAAKDLTDKVQGLEERMKAFTPASASAKAAAILRGAGGDTNVDAPGHWIKALFDWRTQGDQVAGDFIKSVLGTSAATGQAIIPNNFVAQIVEISSAANVWRQVLNVVPGVRGKGVDIPYEVTDHTAALLQGAYGSNKDIRDFTLGSASATLYPVAEIIDLGNQFIRQSEGAAEQLARRRLGKAFARAEDNFILSGTGSSQPKGFFTSLAGQAAAFSTALFSESRAAAVGRAIGALESRSNGADGLAIVMSPTDYWEMATETLGTSGSGGWAFAPAEGPQSGALTATIWGVPAYRDPFWPASKVGTALLVAGRDIDLFFGDEYRIDVSSEAGSRFDQNITGFRAEEEMAFNADPYVLTGHVQQLTGI